MQQEAPATQDSLLTLSAAAKLTPGRPHSSTIFRWHRNGVKGVKLEARRYGGKIFTTRLWLDDFAKRVAEAAQQSADPESHSVKPVHPRHKRTQAQRDKAAQNAVADLKARGL